MKRRTFRISYILDRIEIYDLVCGYVLDAVRENEKLTKKDCEEYIRTSIYCHGGDFATEYKGGLDIIEEYPEAYKALQRFWIKHYFHEFK